MHGYFYKQLINSDENDETFMHENKKPLMTSHFKGQLAPIRDQEILTKFLKHKRQKQKMLTILSHHVTKCWQDITYHFIMTSLYLMP